MKFLSFRSFSVLTFGFLFTLEPSVRAAAMIPGDLAVERIGDGSAGLSSAGTPLFVDEFSTSGTAVQSIALPTSGASAITDSGSASSVGLLNRSADGRFLEVAGYRADSGTASVTNTTSAANPRVVAQINAAGTVDSTTSSSTAFSANNFRSVVSNDGNEFWGAGANTGIVYWSAAGATTSTTISTTVTNARAIDIYGGNLYFSAGASSNFGIYQVGTGLPTATGQTAAVLIATGASSSPYAFAINTGVTVAYIADDRTIASGGGVQKWTLSGGTWSLAYTLGTGTGSTFGARGLAVDFSGANPLIYATTSETSANRLVSIVDTGAGSAATTLATAGSNTIYRGVDFAAVPEPQTWAMLLAGVSALGVWQHLRRRKI